MGTSSRHSLGTFTQRAELIALAQALRLGKGKTVNLHADSQYAFETIHIQGAIYKDKGLPTAENKNH